MNKDEIVILALKIVGIYCLIILISSGGLLLTNFFSIISSGTLESYLIGIIFSVIPFVLLLLLTYFLLFKTNKINKKILKSENITESRSITFKEIQAIAFSVLGIWVLATTIPNIIQIITRYLVIKASTELVISDNMNIYSISYLASLLVKLGIGLYLFFGSKGLVNLWHKFQTTKGMPSN